MKNYNIIFHILGVIIIIASIVIGLTSFTSNFDDLRLPFILLGIALGIIILAIGQVIILLSKSNSNCDNNKKE